jgi:hypothetical protein
MTSNHRKFSLSSRASFFLGVLTILGIFAATIRWAPATHAQQQEPYAEQERDEISPYATSATPSIALQYASIVSTGNTITISRAPVTNSAGALVYDDITLQLAVGANGAITSASGYPKWVASPNLLVGAFEAGTYLGPSNIDSGKMGIVLTGPGIGSGVTVWSVAAAKGYDGTCTVPGNATFWVGPLANSPITKRLKTAGITSTNWSYGILGSSSCDYVIGRSGTWYANDIIGFSQVGNTITIADFSYENKDQSTPADQFTYTAK